MLVTFPDALLPLRREEVAKLLGRRIPGDEGAAELLLSFVRQFPSTSTRWTAPAAVDWAQRWWTC